MPHAPKRLRWQLTLSHFLAIVVTLVCMMAAAVDDARTVAEAVSGLVTRNDTATLAGVLRALAAGSLRLPATGWPEGPPWSQSDSATGSALTHVAYILVVGPDGSLLSSSDAAGAGSLPADRTQWNAIAGRALAGGRTASRLKLAPHGSAVAYGAYPVLDAQSRPVAAVLVADTTPLGTSTAITFWHVLAVFGAATLAVLAGAALFALPSSTAAGYFLSRRLVGRIERLGRAARSLAAGDLTARVDEGRADEVGELARQFNQMAANLEGKVKDLAAERDRVSGVLENRRELAVGVSHELRTPVATMRGYLEAALDGNEGEHALPAAVRGDIETVELELRRLEALIDDLFTLSRVDLGRLELRPAPMDAGAAVHRVAGAIGPLAWRQWRVEVVTTAGEELPLACADVQRVEQIVSNLLGNAVRHTPPGGLVAARVTAEAQAIRLDVQDTGEGIAPDDLPRVFQRFYSGGAASRRDGTGLGLALVKDLTEAMGGTVEASSIAGEGSCFTGVPRRYG